MKFYKLSLIIMFPILLVSALLVIIGIQYTFKTSENDNNIYYSEMTYKMLEESMNNQLRRTSDSIFTDKDFYQLRNELIYQSALKKNIDPLTENESINLLASQYGFNYYYVENTDQAPLSNAPYELVMGFLTQDNKKYTTQTLFLNHDNQLYIGILKNIYTSHSEDKSKSYLVMAPINTKLDLTAMKYIIGVQDIQFVIESDLTSVLSTDISYGDNGIIRITDSECNQVFIPINGAVKNNYFLVAKFDKPEIIKNLRIQTFLIILAVFTVFIFSSIVASFILKKIASQISKTVITVDQIANGHYDIDLQLSGIKEINQLSTSINKLSSTINDKIIELSDKNDETLNIMIEALNATDSYTKGHSDRVSKYARLIGIALKYDDLETLEKASLVHDIGKITIPEQILNKKGPLTDAEFKIIQGHSLTGFKILHKASAFSEIDQLVLLHHEKYDGTGYPHGLKGDDIPLGAQILSIADVYDALTSHRPYRNALSHEEAVKIISINMQGQFSERLIKAFLLVEKELKAIV